MISAKAIQIGKDIDLARCNGNWLAITDLVKRYKKYNSDGAGKKVPLLFLILFFSFLLFTNK